MYIWVAIDVDEQVKEIREYAENYVKIHRLSSPTLTLPFHISLKISFWVPDNLCQNVMNDIRDFCKSIKPFAITVNETEVSGSIIWLTIEYCAELTNIHQELDKLLLDKYGIEQHPFDKDFIFHTSILIMNNEENIRSAFDEIKDINIPRVLDARQIIIGLSKSGQAGTYNVKEKILL